MNKNRNLRFGTVRAMAAILAAGALLFASGCFPTEEELITPPMRTQGTAATYQTYTVTRGTVTSQLQNVTGTLISPYSFDCFFERKDLRFKEFNVKLGDMVAAGQLVASADTSAIEADIRESEYLLKGYQIDMQKLVADGGSPYDIERLQLDIDYQTGLLAQYNDAMNNSTITATGSGMVTYLDAAIKSGDAILPNKTLVRISDTSAIYIDLPVTAEQLTNFRIGMAATIRQNNKEYPGEVIMVPDALPAGSGDVAKVRIVFLQLPTSGTFVSTGLTVSVVFEKRENVIFVPTGMVSIDAATKVASVQLLVGENKVQRVVTIGLRSNMYTEIVSGLAEGDQIVTGSK